MKYRQDVWSVFVYYFKRFYVTQHVYNFDPSIMMITAIFLAAKVEEVPYPEWLFEIVKDIRRDFVIFYEGYLCRGLGYNLNIFTPYWSMAALKETVGLWFEDEKERDVFGNSCMDMLHWAHLKDLILTHKPSEIALGIIHAACKKQGVDIFEVC